MTIPVIITRGAPRPPRSQPERRNVTPNYLHLALERHSHIETPGELVGIFDLMKTFLPLRGTHSKTTVISCHTFCFCSILLKVLQKLSLWAFGGLTL